MEILSTILPILIIVLIGFLSANRQYLSRNDCDSIAKFVFNYLIPILLFTGTVKAEIPDNMQWEFLFSYYIALFFIYVLGIVLAKLVFNFSVVEQSVFSMGCSYSNSTIVGIPVCLYALGERAMLPLFIILSIHNLFLFTLGCFAAERGSLLTKEFIKNFLGILKQLVTSPITSSLIIGGMVNILQIPIYSAVQESLNLMSQAAVPTALFTLGTSLNKYKIHGHIAPALVIVLLKTLLFPFLVWLLVFQVFNINTLWAATALLTSAMPVGISAYIFSHQYNVCEAPIATGIFISTVSSVITLSVLIAYVQSVI